MIIVSSPLGFVGCVIKFEEIEFPHDLTGCFSYCGHPATKTLLEALGASTVTGRWQGPAVGESYLAVPLNNNPREDGYTQNTAIESIEQLKAILCTRIS